MFVKLALDRHKRHVEWAFGVSVFESVVPCHKSGSTFMNYLEKNPRFCPSGDNMVQFQPKLIPLVTVSSLLMSRGVRIGPK